MNAGFDEGDFKKARGMLVSFSSLLIALWFFGADLKSVSVLGTTIAFTKNTKHVWLVALAVNNYFLLRFYQHSPGASYSSNKIYQDSFENFLIDSMRSLRRTKIKEDFFKNMDVLGTWESNKFEYEVVRQDLNAVNNPKDNRRFSRGIARIVKFHVSGTYKNLDASEMKITPALEFGYPCPYWLVVAATYRAKVLANVKTSLGTEYTLPYLWSGWATAICVSQWLIVNAA